MTDLLQPSESLEQIQSAAPSLLQSAREISVIDEASYVECCSIKVRAAAVRKQVDGIWQGISDAQKNARETALMPWERMLEVVGETEQLADRKRKEYRDAQERKAAELVAAEMAAAKKKAEDEQLANAIALDRAGLTKQSDAVLSAPLAIVPVVTTKPAVPKVAGIRDAKMPKVEVVDGPAFLRALGATLMLDALAERERAGERRNDAAWNMLQFFARGLSPDAIASVEFKTTWLRSQYTQQREKFSVPGVKAWME